MAISSVDRSRSARLASMRLRDSSISHSSAGGSGCVVTTPSRSRRVRSGLHSHGYSGIHAGRAEAGLHEHPSRQPKRSGRLLDLLPFPAEVFAEAGVAEAVARSRGEKVPDERSRPFGPDVAVKVESVSVVKDNRDPCRDDLAADGTYGIRLRHPGNLLVPPDDSKIAGQLAIRTTTNSRTLHEVPAVAGMTYLQ